MADDKLDDTKQDLNQLLVLDPAFERELEKKLPEMVTLNRIARSLEGRARIRVEATVERKGRTFPILSVVMGSEDPEAPTLGVFGGVHGLERIGSDVVISWMQSLSETMDWDESLRERLKKSRLVFMPIVNPVGIFELTRSNGNGVDLMRNSPVRAEQPPAFMLGGQSISNKFPWFSPPVFKHDDMEIESQALCRLVEREMFHSKCALTVDVHSGFGSVDRFWFPWAKSKNPPPHLEEITALKKVFDRSYPHHFYQIEPQAKSYTTHGDLWDWMYDRHIKEMGQRNVYVPFTLELGSWLWLKKNPRQVFSSLGAFNPIQPHRLKRILRRHTTLFDFLHRAVISSDPWTVLDAAERERLQRRATELWYTE
ncbi:M14 family metallopeptidase [soil metagenome]